MVFPYYWFSHSEAQAVNGSISCFLSTGNILITGVNQGNCKLKWEIFAFIFLAFILKVSGWWTNILSSIPWCQSLFIHPPLHTVGGDSLLTPFAPHPTQQHQSRASLASFMHILDVCQQELDFLQLEQDLSCPLPIKPASKMMCASWFRLTQLYFHFCTFELGLLCSGKVEGNTPSEQA